MQPGSSQLEPCRNRSGSRNNFHSKHSDFRHVHRDNNRVRQQENKSRKEAVSVSPRTRNRLRVNEMYKLHQQQTANRAMTFKNARPVSSCQNDRRQHIQKNNSPERHMRHDSDILQTLVNEVRDIKGIVTKNERRFVENDRRFTRLEVTVNKSFIVLGDVSNAINGRMLMGNMLQRDDKPPKGYHMPKLPVKRLKELIVLNKDLKNEMFSKFLVSDHLY